MEIGKSRMTLFQLDSKKTDKTTRWLTQLFIIAQDKNVLTDVQTYGQSNLQIRFNQTNLGGLDLPGIEPVLGDPLVEPLVVVDVVHVVLDQALRLQTRESGCLCKQVYEISIRQLHTQV